MKELFLSLDERIDKLAKMTYEDIYQEMDRLVGEFPEEDIYPQLVERLSAFSTKLRRAAIYGLAKIGNDDVALHLVKQLRSSKKGIRQETLKALKSIDGNKVVEVLIDGMGYKDWFARLTASRALAILGTPKALPILINALFNDRSDKVRKESAIAIKKILKRNGGYETSQLDNYLDPYRDMPGYRGFKQLESTLVLETCDNLIENAS